MSEAEFKILPWHYLQLLNMVQNHYMFVCLFEFNDASTLIGYYINDIQVSLTVKNHIFFFLIQHEAIPIARGL